MRVTRLSLVAMLSAAAALVLLLVLATGGRGPEFRGLVRFQAAGIVDVAPERVSRVEIRTGDRAVVLRRLSGAWTPDGVDSADIPPRLGEHVEAALEFLNVSKPSREIGADELSAGDFAGFGLDPPTSVVLLGTDDGPAATVSFGLPNPPGTSQYVRLGGAPTVFLMARHVGGEWEIVRDMVSRLPGGAGAPSAGANTAFLFPVSMSQIWAVEVVRGGKIARFERDGRGDWFRHTGQHNHAAGAPAHTADPEQARIIAPVLAKLGETVIERRIAGGTDDPTLAEFGLAFPETILLLYARDNSTPVARVELGDAAGGFERYARIASNGEVVTIAEFEVSHLSELLKGTEPES